MRFSFNLISDLFSSFLRQNICWCYEQVCGACSTFLLLNKALYCCSDSRLAPEYFVREGQSVCYVGNDNIRA